MKSARERAIDIYHSFMTNMMAKPPSRKLLGMMVEEQVDPTDPVGTMLAALEKEVEADRREILAWAKAD